MLDNVIEHYNRLAAVEWGRLARDPYHSLEFRATMASLTQHLPAQGRVLDAGGGRGRYAIELCRKGYTVALLDLAEGCIALAREKFAAERPEVARWLEGAEVGDVRDLSRFPDNAFDAVLCLGGPLSHLVKPADRRMAAHELARVAKPGSPVFLSVMGYSAVLRTVLARHPSDLADAAKSARFLDEGNHYHTGTGYCDAHFFRPEELKELAEDAGLETVELRALEGLSSNLREATNALAGHDDGRWGRWLEILDRTACDPAVVAISEHFLYVGRRPRQ